MVWRHTTLLEYFKNNSTPPKLKKDRERKIFATLQKYNLIRADHQGNFFVTDNGKVALEMGVKKYLELVDMEEELLQKAPKLKRKSNILIGCLFCLFILIIYLIVRIEELKLGDHFIEKIFQ